MISRLEEIADSDNEQTFTASIQALQTSDVWMAEPSLHSWFEDKWLSEKEVRYFKLLLVKLTFCLYGS